MASQLGLGIGFEALHIEIVCSKCPMRRMNDNVSLQGRAFDILRLDVSSFAMLPFLWLRF